MAQDPLKARKSPKMSLPTVNTGMNKLPPTKRRGKDKADPDQDLLYTARKRFQRCVQAESDNRNKAADDLRFLNGDQWPADVAAQRSTDKRPCLTFNKLKTFVHQVTNDQRQNRPGINLSPVGTQTNVKAAQLYAGLIRAIERESNADIAYDTAFFNAVANGFGYWRVLTEYDDDDTFDQSIRIKRIRNPFTVYLDPDHSEPDGSDAKFAFVTEMLTHDEFKEQYPDAQMVAWDPYGVGDTYKEWTEKDRVRVAEYYAIETETAKLVKLSNGHTGFRDKLDPQVEKWIESGRVKVLAEREAERKTVKWYKITALEVLDRTDVQSEGMIPIVKLVGDEIDVSGKVTYAGIVRDSKDPQRMYNYWRTTEAEVLALQPKAPYVMEEGQAEGHEQQWKQANTTTYPYLLYKGTTIGGKAAPPPQRQPVMQGSQGIIQAVQGSAQDMQAVTGIRFDATLNERVFDESGKALRAIQQIGNLAVFHYIDNLSRSLKYTAKLLIAMIPHVYNTSRTLTILQEDGKDQAVRIDPSLGVAHKQGQTPEGVALPIFNPAIGKYGVAVTIGPSFATKRIEAAEQMLSFVQKLPQAGQVTADLIAKNMDWPEAEQFAARIAKTLPPNLLTPDMANVPPQVQALVQSLQAQVQKQQQALMQAAQQVRAMETDRSLVADKQTKDFEAKVLAILQKAQAANDKNNTESSYVTLEAAKFLDGTSHPKETRPTGPPHLE